MLCIVCQIDGRYPEIGHVCKPCLRGTEQRLRDIPGLYADLDPTPGRGGNSGRPTGKPGSRTPANDDVIDLTSPARAGELTAVGKQLARDFGDQIGHLPIRYVLDVWVRIFRTDLFGGENLPVPTVPVMSGWLVNRLEKAASHPAFDEMAEDVRRVHGLLKALNGDVPQLPVHLDVPCRNPQCNQLGLFRHDGEDYPVRCHVCGDLMSEDEYHNWTRLYAGYEQQKVGA